jgi:BMFP domain-containing protein YqiC
MAEGNMLLSKRLANLSADERRVVMLNKQILDDIAEQISRRLPQLNALGQDVSDNVKGMVQQSLGRLDLVTREEFDVHVRALQRAEDRITELEASISELESRLTP